MERPTFCTDEYLEYLDARYEQGYEMASSAPWLASEFGVLRACAREILYYWIETFGKEKR